MDSTQTLMLCVFGYGSAGLSLHKHEVCRVMYVISSLGIACGVGLTAWKEVRDRQIRRAILMTRVDPRIAGSAYASIGMFVVTTIF